MLALHRLLAEGEFMAALRSDPAAALLRMADPGLGSGAYMAAMAERVTALMAGLYGHLVHTLAANDSVQSYDIYCLPGVSELMTVPTGCDTSLQRSS